MNEIDNNFLKVQLSQITKEKDTIQRKLDIYNINRKIDKKNSYIELKEKAMEIIRSKKNEIAELNMQYMDSSTKLIMLQNQQLLTQLDYQTQQLTENMKKNELLEKKVYNLNKDIEIHKNVEITLADKNKKLKQKLIEYKSGDNKDNNFFQYVMIVMIFII